RAPRAAAAIAATDRVDIADTITPFAATICAPVPSNPITARALAVQTLRQIDQRRGFSNRILAEQLERHPDLERRERGLATALVYGVLRHRGRLDALIDAAAARPKNLSARAREIARVAVFELRELRHPPHAAISQALGLATAL